eukprot:4496841-Amphidinium_carterae.1
MAHEVASRRKHIHCPNKAQLLRLNSKRHVCLNAGPDSERSCVSASVRIKSECELVRVLQQHGLLN